MRLFLSEFVCGGALTGEPLPESLCREGRAMRDAVAADLVRLPDLQVVTTCDKRIAPPESVEIVSIDSPGAETREYERLCRECDAALVIAPEINGELGRRCRIAADLSPRPLNCSLAAIDLCSDKFLLWEHLQRAGVPAIPTSRVQQAGDSEVFETWSSAGPAPDFPVVIKPRFGAGSQSTYLCRDAAELRLRWSRFDGSRAATEAVLQPLVSGRSLSVAAFFDQKSQRPPNLLPIAEQRLTDDGCFQYLGGEIPARDCDVKAVTSLIVETVKEIPGLRGYVGFDILIPAARPDLPMLVEINPRLTTSYVGYRALAKSNLAALLIGESVEAVDWRRGAVAFTAEGQVTWRDD